MIISAFHPLRTSGWNLVERLHPGRAGLGLTYWRLEENLYAITLQETRGHRRFAPSAIPVQRLFSPLGSMACQENLAIPQKLDNMESSICQIKEGAIALDTDQKQNH